MNDWLICKSDRKILCRTGLSRLFVFSIKDLGRCFGKVSNYAVLLPLSAEHLRQILTLFDNSFCLKQRK